MKIALLTDSHAGVRNDSASFHDAMQRFYKNVFYKKIDELGITTIVHLGDIMDRRKYTNTYTSYRLRHDLIEPAIGRQIKWHQILGNHDVMYKNTNRISAFTETYNRVPTIRIYEDPEEINFDGLKVLMVPWINDENRKATIRLLQETDAQVCFGHLELKGFEMYKGSIVSHGDDPNLFSRFDMVLSGHYHHRSAHGNIRYLGCPAEFTWADYGDQKGFHIFDTDTRDLTFIENPYKMFKKIKYNDVAFSYTNQDDLSEYTGCIVKVIVQEKSNPYLFDQFIDALEKFNPHDIQIVEDHLNLGLEDDQDIIDEAESTLDIFKKCINSLEYKNVNKTDLEKTIIELYQEAMAVETV